MDLDLEEPAARVALPMGADFCESRDGRGDLGLVVRRGLPEVGAGAPATPRSPATP